MKSGYYKYANGTRQKVGKQERFIFRPSETPCGFTLLELQSTVKKNNTSCINPS
jgi:hypothetical protein